MFSTYALPLLLVRLRGDRHDNEPGSFEDERITEMDTGEEGRRHFT